MTAAQQRDTAGVDNVVLSVRFHVRDADALAAITTKARELDVRDGQDPPAEYSPQQAIQVVLHGEPEFLFGKPYDDRVLDGWSVEDAVWG